MKKSLLTVLSLVLASIAFQSSADSKANGMTAKQQELCRQACQKRGDKWDPTSASNAKGCTCESGDGNYTITDADLKEDTLDNVVGKADGQPGKRR